jgi:hypothetical protein
MTMAGILMLAGLNASAAALAQTPSPATPVPAQPSGAPLVLVPYEEPGNTDPHAAAVTKELATDLAAAGVAVTSVAPVGHLDAVANAAKICADNGASGLLIPDGRYEQTLKRVPLGLLIVLVKYPTHVEFRLDEVGCDGVVRWSTNTTGDEAPSGVDSVANLGAFVDSAFRTAVKGAVHAMATVTIPPSPPMSVAPAAAAAVTATPPSTYLLLPFEQPKLGDPHAADITHSLLAQLQDRKLVVKVGAPIDHLSAVATAQQLCTGSGTQAIIVPNVRIEQSSFSSRSHASLHLSLLNCGGIVIGHGASEANMGNGFIGNFGAAVTGVSERAMGPALDQLFPTTATPAPAAKS